MGRTWNGSGRGNFVKSPGLWRAGLIGEFIDKPNYDVDYDHNDEDDDDDDDDVLDKISC